MKREEKRKKKQRLYPSLWAETFERITSAATFVYSSCLVYSRYCPKLALCLDKLELPQPCDI